MKINTHGIIINIDDLKKASEDTIDWGNTGCHTDIFFDRETGHVWCVDNTAENWTVYKDHSVIEVCRTIRHHSAQWIADRIHETICELRA